MTESFRPGLNVYQPAGGSFTFTDAAGNVRHVVGTQADGTVTSQDMNAPPPPQVSVPIFTPSQLGATVTWDGLLAGDAPGDPLNSNTDFEAGTDPWTPVNGELSASTAQHHSGTQSALLTPDGTSEAAQITSEMIPVTAGQTYQAAGWIWATAAASATFTLSIDWYDEASAYLSSSTDLVDLPAAEWGEVVNTAVAPSGAVYATLSPTQHGTPAATDLLYLDDISLSPVPNDTPADFDHTEVHLSVVSGFTPSSATLQGTLRKAGSFVVSPLDAGVTYYAALVPVNTSGISGTPSDQASGIPEGVAATEIDAGTVTATNVVINSGNNGALLMYGTSGSALNTNPDFATNAGGWLSVFQGGGALATLTYAPDNPLNGHNTLKVVSNGQVSGNSYAAPCCGQIFAATPGNYLVDADLLAWPVPVHGSELSSSIVMKVVFTNSSGTVLATFLSSVISPTALWNYVSWAVTAPPLTTQAQIFITGTQPIAAGPASGVGFYLGHCALTAVASAPISLATHAGTDAFGTAYPAGVNAPALYVNGSPVSSGGGGGAVTSVAGRTGAVVLATGDLASGTLTVARGGTGLATVPAGSYLSGNGTSAVLTRTAAQVKGDLGLAAVASSGSASDLTTGTLAASLLPSSGISASAITTGTLPVAQLPSSGVSASSLTTGTVPFAQLPTGATSTTVAIGNHTHAASAITGIAAVAISNSYGDLIGKPSLATVATSGSASDLAAGTLPFARIPTGTTSTTVAIGNHTHAASAITGLAAVATSGAYSDLSGRPSLATVATSGSFTDLSNQPNVSVWEGQCNATTTVSGAAIDMPGTAGSFTTTIANALVEISICFDVTVSTAGTTLSRFVGAATVDGTQNTHQCVVGSTIAGLRTTTSQTMQLVVATPGTHTVKLTGTVNNGGVVSIQAADTHWIATVFEGI